MKVLSIKEPFASLIKEKVKVIETRSWKTNYRGELYIHASLKKIDKNDNRINKLLNYIPDAKMQYGKIICKCILEDCIYMDKDFINKIKEDKKEYLCGRYEIGRYAWILKVSEVLTNPIPAKGKLGIWNYNPNSIVLATKNKNKLEELKSIFKDYNILSLEDIKCDIDIIEDEDSFYKNAFKKAKIIYNKTKIPIIADDSGLCLKALNGWPGVQTKRFMIGNDEAHNLAIINKLEPFKDKSASFICSLVYYDGKNTFEGLGKLDGKIVSPRGKNGFGFDTIFELPNKKTLAELSKNEKNKCSARYLACINLKEKIKNINLKN